MPREEDSVAPGPQTVGHTTFPDRTRVQSESIFDPSLSSAASVEEHCRKARAGCVGAELRDRGEAKADRDVAWEQPEFSSLSEYGVTTGSSVDVHAGSSKYCCPSTAFQERFPQPIPADSGAALFRGNSGSNVNRGDAPEDARNGAIDAPSGLHDAPGSSNNSVDVFDGHTTRSFLISWAGGAADIDESVTATGHFPTSLPEETDTLKTSLSGS